MSSWKNVVPRREHRERPQPEWRQKRGLLEKHKDYVQRAKNYHVKEKRISALRKRAADRNPDEFYFKMNSAGVKVSAAVRRWCACECAAVHWVYGLSRLAVHKGTAVTRTWGLPLSE